jgi:hypothetical protein
MHGEAEPGGFASLRPASFDLPAEAGPRRSDASDGPGPIHPDLPAGNERCKGAISSSSRVPNR